MIPASTPTAISGVDRVYEGDIECALTLLQAQGEQTAEQDHLAARGQIATPRTLEAAQWRTTTDPITRRPVYPLNLITRAHHSMHCRAGARHSAGSRAQAAATAEAGISSSRSGQGGPSISRRRQQAATGQVSGPLFSSSPTRRWSVLGRR